MTILIKVNLVLIEEKSGHLDISGEFTLTYNPILLNESQKNHHISTVLSEKSQSNKLTGLDVEGNITEYYEPTVETRLMRKYYMAPVQIASDKPLMDEKHETVAESTSNITQNYSKPLPAIESTVSNLKHLYSKKDNEDITAVAADEAINRQATRQDNIIISTTSTKAITATPECLLQSSKYQICM